MKFDWEKTKEYLLYREQKRAQWEDYVRWGIAIAVIIYGLYSKEYAYAFAIALVIWFLPVIVLPWITGKLYGAKWYLRMKDRNEKRIAGWPKYIRWPLQGAVILLLYYSMNGFKFWPLG